MGRRCSATAKSGRPCPGWAADGYDTCAPHTPQLRAQAHRASSKANSERPPSITLQQGIADSLVRMADLADLPKTIEWVAQQVANGNMTPLVGGVLAQLARAAAQVHCAIDELAERAQQRRSKLSDEQLREALERVRAQQRAMRERDAS